MKNSPVKPTLDDIAFEGRNKVYGAYQLRKTYQARLLRSFIYSLCFFLLLLLAFTRVIHHHSADYYYNPLLDAQVVGVNLTDNPYSMVTIDRSGGSSSASAVMPREIIDDNEVVVNQPKTGTSVPGTGDSTGTGGKGSGESGSGNSKASGGGMEGEVYGSADVNPQFPGGIRAMQAFLKENLENSEIARRSSIRGIIQIYVVILADGSLADIKVVRGLQPELDAEAVRVVRSMPLWKPGMRAGVPVNVRCILPISVSPVR